MAKAPSNNSTKKMVMIFNPHAGKKRNLFSSAKNNLTVLEDIQDMLEQYQLSVDYWPTKHPGHALELAKEAVSKKYDLVIAAGGDGTVGEIANGLVGSETKLAILPLGSFMNIARMLSIPQDIEKAIALIKIDRSRKIDVGAVISISGKKLDTPYYFVESCGVGLEAQLHEHISDFEKGDLKAPFAALKTLIDYYGYKAEITVDEQKLSLRATLVTVANGPFTGASLNLAPEAKLNDHRLTVTIFKMTKWELFRFVFKLIRQVKVKKHKMQTFQAKMVKIETHSPRIVHADARLYGKTPVEFEIIPSALNVITGFPKKDEPASLNKRTYLGY